MRRFLTFARAEKGATAIEYGLIAGLVAVAIIAAVTLAGDNLTTTWNSIASGLDSSSGSSSTSSTSTSTSGT